MMKKKMQRFLAFGLVAAMTLPLVACGNTTNINTDTKQSESAEQSESVEQTGISEEAEAPEETCSLYEKEEEPVKLTLGNTTIIYEQSNGDDVYDNLFKDFFADGMNIDYEFVVEGTTQSDYLTSLGLAITSGDLPDVFQVRTMDMVNELIDSGLAMDITELYAKYETDYIREMYDSNGPDQFEVVTRDGAIYGVPRAGTSGNQNARYTFSVRQDWIDKLGLTVDEDGDGLVTLDEIKMLASEFVANDPGNSGNPVGIAVADDGGAGIDHRSNMINNAFGAMVGYWYQAEDGSYVNGATTSEMKEALAWWADMYAEGLVDPMYGITKTDDIKTMLVNGQTGMFFGSYNGATWVWNDAYILDKEMDWVSYGIDAGDGLQLNEQPTLFSGRYLMISSDCENPDAAMKLILWDLVLQVATAYAGGVEEALPTEVLEWIQNDYPEFYEQYLVDNAPCLFKRVNPIQFSTYNDAKKYIYYYNVMDYKAGKLSRDQLSDVDLAYLEAMEHVEDGTATETERMKADEFDGVKSFRNMQDNKLATGIVTPLQLATDVTAIYEGDLQTMVAEMMVKIITGEEPIDYFDTFVEKYYQSGGNEIAAEYEAAYN